MTIQVNLGELKQVLKSLLFHLKCLAFLQLYTCFIRQNYMTWVMNTGMFVHVRSLFIISKLMVSCAVFAFENKFKSLAFVQPKT